MKRMMPVVVSLALLAPLAVSATAGEVPSAWWIEKMNKDFAAASKVRLKLGRERVVLWTPTVDAEGVSGQPGGPVRLTQVGGGVGPAPTRIAWARIDAVETATKATGLGALLGGAAGTLAAILVATSTEDDEGSSSSDWQVPLMIAGGVGIGAAVGGTQERWHTYYPPSGTRENAFDVRLKEVKP